MRKVIPNSNNTIEEKITKLITTGIKFGLNDKLMGALIDIFLWSEGLVLVLSNCEVKG